METSDKDARDHFKLNPFGQNIQGIKKEFRIPRRDLIVTIEQILVDLVGKKGLNADQVVILSDGSHDSLKNKGGTLFFGQKIGSFLLADSRGDKKIYLDTIRRFKGLEAEVVITVYQKYVFKEVKSERLAYLASTRAKGGYFGIFVDS